MKRLLLVLAACKGEGKDFTKHLPEQQRALQMQMATWMPPDAEKAWQGAWLIQLVTRPARPIDFEGDRLRC